MNFDVILCLSQRKEMKLFGIFCEQHFILSQRLYFSVEHLRLCCSSMIAIPALTQKLRIMNRIFITSKGDEKRILAIHPHKGIRYLWDWLKTMDISKFTLGYIRTTNAEVAKGLKKGPCIQLLIFQSFPILSSSNRSVSQFCQKRMPIYVPPKL